MLYETDDETVFALLMLALSLLILAVIFRTVGDD
jgi:cbb3-type cytochrome oxidase subunit 3